MSRSIGHSLLLLALAVLGAEVLGRAAGWGALGPGSREGDAVALTFDDGPSERTTELLSVLARRGAGATFFVTEPACRHFPDALAELRRSGQQIESHGRWHTHALLLLPPWREWQQLAWHPRAAEGTGGAPYLYRPPFGGHSPLTRVFARLLGREVMLWDTEGRDWTALGAPELARQTLQRTRPGSVILLHDGPAVTPELLERLLQGLGQRGLRAVKLRDLPPQRTGLRDGLRRLRQSYGG